MKLKRYCVTVMDNWTPMRTFWTRDAAARWCRKHRAGHLFAWDGSKWVETDPYAHPR
jgi:hypothetical protein